ncbi:unnamed protein product [Arabidopsis lyrata]|uniref:Predicted protein n=1 Tax=Arabidopsis lyrata subsp. lyrata TaxID=81972 RepID=D7MUK0_ARALL|nr:uncharacterized protein LOC9300805 [Arabidopsis lyrata subsp. lyrata]EFH40988.1 predicted protein [Arabidopsis lyrata subsp. lyrata]CAH8280436.1 unnamed protein product [Arabidopsis lyrata]|eukprot:XP_002864729.1 uncharacterized protein LOC9300805 [Arabidopsis lyrata subsp. lyrata]
MVEGENFDCEEQRITHFDLRNDPQFPMVFVRESTDFAKDDLAIFPPINHENLYIDGFDKDREYPSESSSPSSSSRLSDSSLSPSDSDEQFQFCRKSHSQPSEAVGKSRWKSIIEIDIIQVWWKILLARVMPKFQNLVTCFSRNSLCSFSKTLRSFYPVMVIVLWWWMRNRTRRRHQKGEIIAAHFRDTIKERDERIAQLLHQITQMNELLVKITHSN